jgi:hypothetical protein
MEAFLERRLPMVMAVLATPHETFALQSLPLVFPTNQLPSRCVQLLDEVLPLPLDAVAFISLSGHVPLFLLANAFIFFELRPKQVDVQADFLQKTLIGLN